MSERTAGLIVWTGGGVIFLAAVAAVALQVAYGESVFVARLVSGIANCL